MRHIHAIYSETYIHSMLRAPRDWQIPAVITPTWGFYPNAVIEFKDDLQDVLNNNRDFG